MFSLAGRLTRGLPGKQRDCQVQIRGCLQTVNCQSLRSGRQEACSAASLTGERTPMRNMLAMHSMARTAHCGCPAPQYTCACVMQRGAHCLLCAK